MNADHIGVEIEKEALGQKWRFSRWTREVWRALASWAKDVLPDPYEALSKNLDKIALKDAEILRQLQIADNAERVKAKAESRPAILMAPQFRPFADTMVDKIIDKANSYLSFNSPELNSLINSAMGGAQLYYLLLKPNHPDITEEQAYEIMLALSSEDAKEIVAAVSGRSHAKPKNE